MDMNEQLAQAIARNVDAALSEDIGSGDLTALLTPAGHPARGIVVSREAAVLCGSAWFDACFHRLDTRARIRWHARDGDRIDAGQTLCEIEADTRALLTAERPALNFLQLLSATATATPTLTRLWRMSLSPPNELLRFGKRRSAKAAALTTRSFTEALRSSGTSPLICLRSAIAAAISTSMVR